MIIEGSDIVKYLREISNKYKAELITDSIGTWEDQKELIQFLLDELKTRDDYESSMIDIEKRGE